MLTPDVDVVVIGGGLAGCASATLLAREGVSVALLEKGDFPRHKLCGEFLSPEAQASFDALGVLGSVREAGAHEMRHARITGPHGGTFDCDLPGTALGLSRYVLDEMLFQRASDAGARTFTQTRVTGVDGSLNDGFRVRTDRGSVEARVVLGAYGKRSLLDRKLDRSFMDATSDLVAFKAHFGGPSIPETIEIHTFPGGYCGMSHIEDDRVNVCWIGRTDVLKDSGGRPEQMLAASAQRNPHLADRLDGAERLTDAFEAVSQVSLRSKPAFSGDICMIGDAAGMIAPLCGDGMAMALSSAEIATPHVLPFLRRNQTPEAFRAAYTEAWGKRFGQRMRIGRLAHAAAMRPRAAAFTVTALNAAPAIGRWLVRATRG